MEWTRSKSGRLAAKTTGPTTGTPFVVTTDSAHSSTAGPVPCVHSQFTVICPGLGPADAWPDVSSLGHTPVHGTFVSASPAPVIFPAAYVVLRALADQAPLPTAFCARTCTS